MFKMTFLIIGVVFLSNSFAAEQKPLNEVQISDIIKETQKQPPMSGGGDKHIAIAWWIPIEYWRSALGNDTSINDSQKDEIFKALEDYFLLAIVQADITSLGAFNFYSKKEIEGKLLVTSASNNHSATSMTPIKKLDPNLEVLLAQITPILGAAMGNLGNNFHFYVFNDRSTSNERFLDPYIEGALDVQLEKRSGDLIETNFEMPLNSLFYPRKCPNGKDAHISWKYCPWSGEKLK